MTTHPYPADPHACLQAAERDIAHYLDLLAGDGIEDRDMMTAAYGIRLAARARRRAREQIEAERSDARTVGAG